MGTVIAIVGFVVIVGSFILYGVKTLSSRNIEEYNYFKRLDD